MSISATSERRDIIDSLRGAFYPERVDLSKRISAACVLLLTAASGASASPPDPDVIQVRDQARRAAEKMRYGDALLRLNDLRGACKAYQQTIRILPTWWMPRLAVVRCGRLVGLPLDELVEHAAFAVKARPKIPLTHVHYGLVLEEAGRREDAAKAYRQALVVHSDLFEARYRLGVLLTEMGKPREARRHLEEVLARQPDHVVARNLLTGILLKLGDTNAAERSLRELVRTSRNPGRALSRLARFYEAQGLHREAEALRREHKRRFSLDR